jgi:hypothetical protein
VSGANDQPHPNPPPMKPIPPPKPKPPDPKPTSRGNALGVGLLAAPVMVLLYALLGFGAVEVLERVLR